MELKLEVYNPALELLGLLEIQRSVIWESKAFGAGSFSLESLITEESRALLVPENIIWIEGDTAGVIEHIEQQAGTDGPYITVKGRDLTGLLDRRILWGLYDLNATPPAIMRYLVQDNAVQPTRGDTDARKIPGLVLLDAPAGGQSIRYQKTGGSLLDALELLGEAYQVAFGVRFNAAVPRMEFWTRWGVDRSVTQSINDPVFYSTELDDVLESEYSYDSANYRNVSLVAGEGEGKDRIMVTVEGTAEPEPQPPEPGKEYTITLSVDPEGGGTVSGGGKVSEGVSITVSASPAEGYEFSGWREGTEIVSTDAAYTFQVSADRSLTAVFAVAIPMYTITLSIDPTQADWGSVSGGGTFEEGVSVTVTATPAEGYQFVAWQEGGQNVSADASYTFAVTSNKSLTATFEEKKKELAYHGTITALSVARNALTAVSFDNYAMFAGGYNGNRLATVDAYNENLTRSTPTALSSVKNYLSSTTVGEYALFGGGLVSNTSYSGSVNAYDKNLTRTTQTNLSQARCYLAAASLGNYALFGGGKISNVFDIVDAYDENLTRTTPTNLSAKRTWLNAASIGDYALFGGGGTSSTSYSSVVDAYNKNLTRTTPASLAIARGYLSAVSTINYVLFGGGQSSSSSYASTVEAYNKDLTRTIPTNLIQMRSNLAAARVGNYALFGGGSPTSTTYTSIVDAYDENLVRNTPHDLSSSRNRLAAATVGNYALFGGGHTGSAYSSVVDAYTLK